MKNIFLKLLLDFIRPWIAKHPTTKKRILVVTTTALGDTLWATPALESLKKSFPDCYLAVLTSSIGMQILEHNPYIDCLYHLERPISLKLFKLLRLLYADAFNTILLFHASQRLVLPLCTLLGASRIIGTTGSNKGLDSLLTDPLPSLRQHEIIRRLKMVERIGGTVHTQTLSFFLRVEERLPRKERRWIALHPGSKDKFKRWPAENFAEVGRALKERFSCEILVTGTEDEREVMQKTASLIPGAQFMEQNLRLRAFAALLEQMELLICNDTGAFHLACALQIPAIGIYSATDPFFCGPHLAINAIAIAKRASCTPCLKRKCRDSFCLLQIGTLEVIEMVRALVPKP